MSNSEIFAQSQKKYRNQRPTLNVPGEGETCVILYSLM